MADPLFRLLQNPQLDPGPDPGGPLPRLELNPVSFVVGLRPRLLQAVLQPGPIPTSLDDGQGWTLPELYQHLQPLEAETRPEALQRYAATFVNVQRLCQLYLEPTSDELRYEYGFDPRVDRGEIFFVDLWGWHRVLSPTGNRNPDISAKLGGTSYRLLPPAVWQAWAQPGLFLEWTFTRPVDTNNGRLLLSLYEQLGLVPNLELAGEAMSARPPLPIWLTRLPGLHLPPGTEEGRVAGVRRIYNPSFGKDYPRRLETLRKLAHPGLAAFEGAVMGDDYSLYLLHQPLQSLEEVLASSPEAATRRSWCLQLALGLEYLHRQGLVHNRLTPAMVGVTGSEMKMLFLDGDHIGSVDDLYQYVDMAPYRPVEAYRTGSRIYANDVHALGYIMYYILTGSPAYADIGSQGWILQKMIDGELPLLEGISPPALQVLLKGCWLIVPELRPSASEVVQELRRADAS